MEHPDGRFARAVDALADAVARLRSRLGTNAWLTFTAQGQGGRADSYAIAQIRLRGDRLDVGGEMPDADEICRAALLPPEALALSGSHYVVTSLSPDQTARLIDSIFRRHAGIRPFPDEGDDYAVGAEW